MGRLSRKGTMFLGQSLRDGDPVAEVLQGRFRNEPHWLFTSLKGTHRAVVPLGSQGDRGTMV